MTKSRTAAGVGALFLASLLFAKGSGAFLYLKIYRYSPRRLADEPLGYVPVDPTKPVPARRREVLYVKVLGALNLFTVGRLARTVRDRQLPGLDLSRQSQIVDSDIALLSAGASWDFLSLADTQVTDAAMADVARIRNLRVLRLSPRVGDAGLERLAPLGNLCELSLAGTQVTGRALAVLAHFPKMETLDLSADGIHDEDLDKLPRLPLKSLTLGRGITDRAMPTVVRFRKLRQLDLSSSRVTDAGLSSLKKLRSLDTLFAGPEMTSAGLAALAELRGLKRLDLSGTNVTETSLAALAALDHLTELALTRTRVDDSVIHRVASLSGLKVLDLSGTGVTPAGWAGLREMKNLEVLAVSLTGPGRAANLESLLSLPKLRLLIVNGKAFSKDGIERLKEAVSAPRAPAGNSEEGSNGQDVLAALSGMRSLYVAKAEESWQDSPPALDFRFN